MPSFRDRMADALLGKQKQQLVSAFRELTEFYLAGPYDLGTSPEALKASLAEYDSAILQDLVHEIEWERMGVLGYDPVSGEPRRIRSVQESRRLDLYDVVTGFIYQLWTDFGFGENLKVMPKDEEAAAVWAEFANADRNQAVLAQDRIQNLSHDTLTDGEIFLAYYVSTTDGEVTVRTVDCLEIVAVITDPEDSKRPLLYKRQWTADGRQRTLLYPDWLAWLQAQDESSATLLDDAQKQAAAAGAERADKAKETTVVLMQHIAYKMKQGIRGWPLMVAGAPWSRAHRRFREDRASVAAALALYAQKIKAKGGSRGIEAIRAKLGSTLGVPAGSALETNPPAVAGSTFLENEAATLTKLPMGTGAGDAREDGGSLLMMAGLGGGVYPHWLGAGEAFRLATATAMEAPMHRQFSRYKQFWSAQFRRMLRIVLAMAEKYSGKRFTTTDAEVTSDRLIEVDLELIGDAMTGLLAAGLQPYFEAGQVDANTAGRILAATWRTVLQALGVEDVEKVATEEGFGVTPESEEAAVREARPFRSGGAGDSAASDTAGDRLAETAEAIREPGGTAAA